MANASTEGMSIMESVTAENDATLFNMTGLLTGTAYEFTVLAVSQGGDVIVKGQPSDNITGTTVIIAIVDDLEHAYQSLMNNNYTSFKLVSISPVSC